MDGKIKRIAGIALVLSVLSIALVAAPIQAYISGNVDGDLLQTQERERSRTQEQDYTCDCTQTQHRNRQRTDQCATNRICNCTVKLEQHRYQYRQRTESLGN